MNTEKINAFAFDPCEFPFNIEVSGITDCTDFYLTKRDNSYCFILEYIVKGKGTLVYEGKNYSIGTGDVYFLQKGYDVKAFDPSKEMIKYASEFTGIKINEGKWEDLDAKEAYDGIWASASLYHVSRADMAPTFKKISDALKSKGILFASFRDRPDDFVDSEGRALTSFDKVTFTDFLSTIGLFDILKLEERIDTRKDKKNEKWLFAFLQKKI